MAVKKSETKKTSTPSKAAAGAKAAPKKAAPKKAAPKKSTKPAEAKSKPAPAPAARGREESRGQEGAGGQADRRPGPSPLGRPGGEGSGLRRHQGRGPDPGSPPREEADQEGEEGSQRLLPIPGDQGGREARPGPGSGRNHGTRTPPPRHPARPRIPPRRLRYRPEYRTPTPCPGLHRARLPRRHFQIEARGEGSDPTSLRPSAH